MRLVAVLTDPETDPTAWFAPGSKGALVSLTRDVVAECRTPAHLARVVDALSGRRVEKTVADPRFSSFTSR